MASWLDFVCAALATYYLAKCVSSRDIEGPFAVFLWLRNRFTAENWMGRGIRCHICVSLYAALLMSGYLIWRGPGQIWDWPLVWLGLAGASVLIEKYWSR